MHLSDDDKKIGKDNYNSVLGSSETKNQSGTTRRDFLKQAALAGVASGAGLGAMYFGYDKKLDDPLRIGVIGTGDEGGVLISALNPDFVQVVAIADIRPYSIHRAFHGDWYGGAHSARRGLMDVYGWGTEAEARQHIEVYEEDYEALLDNPDVEAVIIALPLWLHDVAAIKAMRKGKHVLTEKLMGHTVHQCKEMARVAYDTGMLLATGHQRHYSVMYDNAVDTIRRGVIGDIHHIRAQWHRGNSPGNDSWQPPLPTEMYKIEDYNNLRRAARKEGKEAEFRAAHKTVEKIHSLEKKISTGKQSKAKDKFIKELAQAQAQLRDFKVDALGYGYQDRELTEIGRNRPAIEELIRWRIWDRTGAGLMAELGSHQLDAAGIFISSQFENKVKAHPLSVVGIGNRSLFPKDRDCDDHVYCSFEFPGKGYFENNDPTTEKVADANKKVVVSYSSINGNGFGGYGEVVLGTKGTMILEREKETLLFGRGGSSTRVKVNKDKLVTDSYETGGGANAAVAKAATDGPVSRGYTEEIEHWAWCIRNKAPIKALHCNPEVALSDAVIALTTNIALKKNQRIEFDPEWFDPKSDKTPEGIAPKKASEL